MKPNEFIRKIYYGDSGCKKLIIDGWSGSIQIQLDSIFIMKGDSFNYFVDEEINDGFIIFEGVSNFSWSGNFIPNDLINSISCNSDSPNERGEYSFTVCINHVDSESHSHEVSLLFSATNVSIKNKSLIIQQANSVDIQRN